VSNAPFRIWFPLSPAILKCLTRLYPPFAELQKEAVYDVATGALLESALAGVRSVTSLCDSVVLPPTPRTADPTTAFLPSSDSSRGGHTGSSNE
jgi:hypothetical protein